MQNLVEMANDNKMMNEVIITPINSMTTGTTGSSMPLFSKSQSNGNYGSVIQTTLPKELIFNNAHLFTIIANLILIFISSVGNITVLIAMCRRRRRRKAHTRINTMLMHLAIADLLVTFLMMPIDVYWAYTVKWTAGDIFCRLAAFSRIFGLYLSSFIIICISVDRYFAVLKPMNLYQVDRRGKTMLTSSWALSIIFSVPQILIFHVEKHPEYPIFEQCVVYNAYSTKFLELFYLYFSMFIMYLLPFLVILYCYISIVREIFRRSRDSNVDCTGIRRSGLGFLGRAKSRTLKMTIIIVLVFVICWTPYYVMSVWFWIDPESAKSVDMRIQRALFVFASANSCMNPIVYGIFNIRTHRALDNVQNRAHTYTGRTSYATDIRLPALTLSLRSVE